MPSSAELSLRSLAAADAPGIEELLRANQPVFSDEECATVVEMIHETLADPDASDPYQWVVSEVAGRVVGFACFGTIALTEGTFDLYWIAVHPACHGRGIGRKLLLYCEQEIARQGGRLVVVETSSRREYEATRRFYEKTMRYETAASIKDFYRRGDDKVIYVKYVGGRHG
jgi:ribosomal protein S18 acetylase RimI-like enzyme